MQTPYKPLTQVVHEVLGTLPLSGQTVVDATCGNGHDTLWLAMAVGDSGKVIALDIQEQALLNTLERLEAAGLQNRVTLLQRGHEEVAEVLHELKAPELAAAVFNLGYLPGGNKELTTQAASTRQALEQVRLRLIPAGVISVLCYPGHPQGEIEMNEVEAWAREVEEEWIIEWTEAPAQRKRPPRLLIVRRAY